MTNLYFAEYYSITTITSALICHGLRLQGKSTLQILIPLLFVPLMAIHSDSRGAVHTNSLYLPKPSELIEMSSKLGTFCTIFIQTIDCYH